MRPRETHEWTERAVAADPAQEAFYRHHEWFCLWIAQGREWGAARRKLERQAWKRAGISIAAAAACFQALTASSLVSTGAAEAAFRVFAKSAQGLWPRPRQGGEAMSTLLRTAHEREVLPRAFARYREAHPEKSEEECRRFFSLGDYLQAEHWQRIRWERYAEAAP